MSFFSNFQSDKCPGAISGNPLNGMCEKVCIQAQKIFDACIKQVQIENYTMRVSEFTPANPTYPLTFISARSTSAGATLTDVSVERLADKQGCARVQATVNIPVEVAYTDANGVEGVATGTISVNEDVLLYVPAPSIMPFKVVAEASAVAAEGSFNSEGGNQRLRNGYFESSHRRRAVDTQLRLLRDSPRAGLFQRGVRGLL